MSNIENSLNIDFTKMFYCELMKILEMLVIKSE